MSDLKSKTVKAKKEPAETSGELKAKVDDGSKFKKIMLISVGAGILVVILLALVMYLKSDDKGVPAETPEGEVTEVEVTNEEGGTEVIDTTDKPWLSADGGSSTTEAPKENLPKLTEPSDKVTPGITDPSKDQYVKNYSAVEKDTFVKDLNAKAVPENYNIGEISTVVDFVSYKKKRAVVDTGIEMYWLEATYKGKKAKIQVPFRIFKELDPEGVTVVDVEVTAVPSTTEGEEPHQIVTNFTVRDDYKEVLQNNGNSSSSW